MKQKNDYFKMMGKQISLSLKAANQLIELLEGYKPEDADKYRIKMHKIEHDADEVRHDALNRLNREFITPIERDDILQLVQIIDDVTDAIEDVAIDLYMYNVQTLPEHAISMAGLVKRCVTALEKAIGELHNFKRSDTLRPLLVEVNDIESEADDAYLEAVRALFTTEQTPMTCYGLKAIYDALESCCDLCERAADVIENVAMKNT